MTAQYLINSFSLISLDAIAQHHGGSKHIGGHRGGGGTQVRPNNFSLNIGDRQTTNSKIN